MIGTILIFFIIFFVIVMGHEFGHFLLAKVNGIKVNEFSIGMGPKIAGFRKGETEYCIRALPIGGACLFEGEDGLKSQNGSPDPGNELCCTDEYPGQAGRHGWRGAGPPALRPV